MDKDRITGLLNVAEFMGRAEKLIRDTNKRYAVIIMDVSNFRYFNDFYGVDAGDDFLRVIAKEFCIDNPNCVLSCRSGSDQFRLLIDLKVSQEEEVEYIKKKNIEFESFCAKNYPRVFLHLYTGVYFVINPEEGIRACVDRAHMAKKAAKGKFNIKCSVYSNELLQEKMNDMKMMRIFESACDDDRILVYLQPKYSSSKNQMIGAEALARIRAEDGSIIPPGMFVPIIVRNGMVLKLDEIMLKKVFQIQRHLQDHGRTLIPISVNISRIGFSNPLFLRNVVDLASQYDVPHEMIELEITERTLIEGNSAIMDNVVGLRAEGFRISVDDFGSGYSSLNQIASIPADVIKLDGIFARKEIKTVKGRKVMKAIIEMLLSVEFEVLCEGVETKEECNIINSYGCDEIQGYYYAHPKPWQEIFHDI